MQSEMEQMDKNAYCFHVLQMPISSWGDPVHPGWCPSYKQFAAAGAGVTARKTNDHFGPSHCQDPPVNSQPVLSLATPRSHIQRHYPACNITRIRYINVHINEVKVTRAKPDTPIVWALQLWRGTLLNLEAWSRGHGQPHTFGPWSLTVWPASPDRGQHCCLSHQHFGSSCRMEQDIFLTTLVVHSLGFYSQISSIICYKFLHFTTTFLYCYTS